MSQWDEAAWKRQDAEYAEARAAIKRAGQRWRAAGGYWHVGGKIDAPDEYREVAIARSHYYELSELACPPSFSEWLAELREGIDYVEPVIGWLERDVFCRDSGYRKQRIYRYLYKFEFTAEERVRLQDALLRGLARGPRRELRELAHLAKRVDDDRFRTGLGDLKTQAVEANDKWLAMRVEIVAASIARSGLATPPRIPLTARLPGRKLGRPGQA